MMWKQIDPASPTLFISGYLETPSSFFALLEITSKLGKFKPLCSLGWASVEVKEFEVGTVVSLLEKPPCTVLDQDSHHMMLRTLGTSNRKSKFHMSICFGNTLLASCHSASCQGKSPYQGGRCWQLKLTRPIMQDQKWGARADATAAQSHAAFLRCYVFVLLGKQLRWMPLNSFLAEIL